MVKLFADRRRLTPLITTLYIDQREIRVKTCETLQTGANECRPECGSRSTGGSSVFFRLYYYIVIAGDRRAMCYDNKEEKIIDGYASRIGIDDVYTY